MHLIKHLDKNSIITGIEPQNKSHLLEMMVDAVICNPALQGYSKETILKAVHAREAESSTSLGEGFGFPHARLPQLPSIAVSLAILKEPINYDSIGRLPIKIACLILVPLEIPTLALKVMSQVVRMFHDPESRQRLTGSSTREDVFDCIANSRLDLDVPITAQDIMRSEVVGLSPEMPLRKVSRLLSDNHIFAAPVIDENRRMLGEISCENLFRHGMPDFFLQLKTVAFISEFDPFEKYFYNEAHSKAKDVLSKEFCTISTSTTLIEIVFELVVKGRRTLYVLEDERLVGVIDPSIVLDQVINV
jgi:mannitol/fructose-specific phosphotransferase system IIA component (Ntr-type)